MRISGRKKLVTSVSSSVQYWPCSCLKRMLYWNENTSLELIHEFSECWMWTWVYLIFFCLLECSFFGPGTQKASLIIRTWKIPTWSFVKGLSVSFILEWKCCITAETTNRINKHMTSSSVWKTAKHITCKLFVIKLTRCKKNPQVS